MYCNAIKGPTAHTDPVILFAPIDLALGRRGMDRTRSLVLGQVPKTNGIESELFCVSNGC